MPLTPDEALTAISQAVAELNLSLPPEKQISSDPDAILFGEGGQLDSLGLVNLVDVLLKFISLMPLWPLQMAHKVWRFFSVLSPPNL